MLLPNGSFLLCFLPRKHTHILYVGILYPVCAPMIVCTVYCSAPMIPKASTVLYMRSLVASSVFFFFFVQSCSFTCLLTFLYLMSEPLINLSDQGVKKMSSKSAKMAPDPTFH